MKESNILDRPKALRLKTYFFKEETVGDENTEILKRNSKSTHFRTDEGKQKKKKLSVKNTPAYIPTNEEFSDARFYN